MENQEKDPNNVVKCSKCECETAREMEKVENEGMAIQPLYILWSCGHVTYEIG